MSNSGSTPFSPVRETQESTAAGIHGLIVSAAVMAAAHTPSAVATVVAVLVTLTIYWAAERYARIVAERIHQGQRPGWETIRRQLVSGWEMVTTSVLPLVVLVVVRLTGASLQTAIVWALCCTTVLLGVAGWRMDRGGRLTVAERVLASAVASIFGVGLILLKILLH